MLALGMLVCLLVAVIIYCCWGTCWKYFRPKCARRRARRSLTDERTGDGLCSHQENSPTRRTRSNERSRAPRSSRSRGKFPEVAPPTYEALFSEELKQAPPTYSTLELNSFNDSCQSDFNPRSNVAPCVTIEVERTNAENDGGSDVRREIDHCQDASSLRGSCSQPSIVQVK